MAHSSTLRVENHQYWYLSINIFSFKNAFWFHCAWIVFQNWRRLSVAHLATNLSFSWERGWVVAWPAKPREWSKLSKKTWGDFHENLPTVTNSWSRTCFCISYRRNLISLLLYKVFHTVNDDKSYCYMVRNDQKSSQRAMVVQKVKQFIILTICTTTVRWNYLVDL